MATVAKGEVQRFEPIQLGHMHILTFPTRIKNKHCFFFFLLPFLKIERREREKRERERVVSLQRMVIS